MAAPPQPFSPTPPNKHRGKNMCDKKDKIVVYRRDEIDDELLENLVKAVKGKTRLYSVKEK